MGVVESQEGAPLRPRATSWGDLPDRAALHQIAEDVAARAGFGVCAIEVLRSDGMLEFVAIHGSLSGQRLLGQGSPVGAMTPIFNCGADFGAFTFVAAEWMTVEALTSLREHGHVPRLQTAPDRDAWHAEDVLAARLRDSDGELCAVLYLDEPFSGMRLRPDDLLALSDELQLAFRAVVTTVERESFSQQFKLGRAARKVIRSATNQQGLEQLLSVAQGQLRIAFRAVDLHIHVFGPRDAREEHDHAVPHAVPELEEALGAAARLAWAEGHVVIAEREEIWGGERLEVRHAAVLAGAVEEHGVRSIVVVPITGSSRLLGAMVVVRGADDVRWTDSESAAALEVGHDLGRAVLDARAFEKEQQLNVELRRLDSYRAELIATVLHELKNPIGVITGHLELLEAWTSAPPEVKASLTAMGKGASRLESLAEDLLILGRLGGPDQAPERVPVDLAAVVRETAELTSVVSSQAGVRVEVSGTDVAVLALGDAADLSRVVDNLLSNAVKYSDAGSTVRVRLEADDGEVLLSIADEGLGISADDQERLFTEFFRSTNTAALTRPGTGLGLAIARRIVVTYGGSIELDSELGVGTTFRVRLPAA